MSINNIIKTGDVNAALSQEAVQNFRGEFDKLAEILGIFAPETLHAGTALYQYKVTGELNNDASENGSSGDKYVEGDLVALSHYKVEKTLIDDAAIRPYRKMTTAQAILKGGYEQAVLKTDRKMLSQLRGEVVSAFFGVLDGDGIGTASGKTLQAALAKADAALANKMEDLGDEASYLVHFVNRDDAADYLANAEITMQTAFGMTYLQNFLGAEHVLLTNKVKKGNVFVTDASNITPYAIDFAELAISGLVYEQDDSGIIGVAHAPAYDRVSTETHILCGLRIVPEVTDYIVKATIAPSV